MFQLQHHEVCNNMIWHDHHGHDAQLRNDDVPEERSGEWVKSTRIYHATIFRG